MSSESDADGQSPEINRRIAELEREAEQLRQENAALRESEAYWRSLVQAAPVFLMVIDREYRILFINRPGEGYQADQVLGLSIVEGTAPEYRELLKESVGRVFTTGCTANYEARDAAFGHWYSNTVGPLYRDGQIVAVVQCSENITEKQEIRQQLCEAEWRWRTLLNSAPDIIVLFNAEGRVRFINRTTEDYRPVDVVGQRGVEFLLEGDRAPLERAIAEVFRTGESRDVQITESRGGRSYLSRIALIGSFEGEPMAMAVLRDITEERIRQQELLESETRLRLAVESAPMVLWTTDRDLRFTSSMGAGLKSLGMQSNQNVGVSLSEYFGTTDAGFPALKAHLEALEGESVEYTQEWANTVFQSHVEPLRDAQGEIVGTIGIAFDVTARHATEAELRATGNELEMRVRERAAALDAANQKLRIDIEHRRLAEQELRASEERFRLIVEGLPVAVVIIRRSDQRVMYVNQQACDLYGATPEELYQGAIQLPCGDPVVNKQCMDSLDRGHMLKDFEAESHRTDGTPIWISLSLMNIQYQGDEAFICGLLDTTRRKQAEEDILRDRRLLTQLLDLNERDRQLIAYEIHDGFVQDVTAAVMFLEAAQVPLSDADDQVTQQLAQALELLRDSVAEARRLINGLRPPVLEEAGVVAAVEELIRKMENQYGLEIELVTDLNSDRMAPALEMAVFRIVQEGLTNVQRHSNSDRAYVAIGRQWDRLKLEVRDWGRGFDLATTPKKRYGLTGMLERAKLLGGKTVIDTRPGQGTRIRVDLPLVALEER